MANFVKNMKVKSVMIPLIVLIIVIVIVGVVLGLKESGQIFKEPAEEEETVEEVEDIEEEIIPKKQVYNISNNLFDYEEAKHVCEAYGGDSAFGPNAKLTMKELIGNYG